MNSDKPLVSILIATYNPNESYFIKSFKSIINQTYDNIEIILIDDGGNIDLCGLINKNKLNCKNLKIIKNPINLGLPRSLNIGIEYCHGKYIARMDDDDIMNINRIEKQVNFLESNKDYVGCWSNYYYINEYDKVIHKSKIDNKNYLNEFLKKGNICVHSSFMIIADILKKYKYNEKYIYAQDIELYMRLLEKNKLGCLKDYLIRYRINKNTSVDKKLLSYFNSYITCLKYVLKNKNLKTIYYLLIRTIISIKYLIIDIKKV